ncbi:Thioredoxin [Dorcoceras hygrometricum]|nr:Thioredoxin [Dorcoceras hygrometricum]
MKNLLRYREQIRNQLFKDKPAGPDLQEQIKQEGTLSSKVMNSHKMGITLQDRGTLSSEDDEDQLKSDCRREEKKRALNISKKQPARTRPAPRRLE